MRSVRWQVPAAVIAGILGLTVAACGSSSSSTKPQPVAFTFSGSGKQGTFQVPASVKGGLVDVTLTNSSKGPASAQLVRLDAGHTAQEALKIIAAQGPVVIPDWLHGEGGPEGVAPGQKATTTVNLPAGHYLVQNDATDGPPQIKEFDVTAGDTGDLPSTDATVTADSVGKDKYEWKDSGLKAGTNTLTFNSKGDEALHHLIAAPIKGNATIDDVKKALETQGKPSGPPPIDEKSIVSTSVLDGGKSEVTTLSLKPGRYAFICFLTDRNEKKAKPHFEEGLLKEVTIK